MNPTHLEPVTHAENVRRGSQTKLTKADVREIRRLHGTASLKTLGRQFGVSHTVIRRTALGLDWRDVD